LARTAQARTPDDRLQRGHLHARSRLHLGQSLHVPERSRENIAGTGKARFVALADGGAAVADRDAVTLRPVGDFARNDDGTRVALRGQTYRNLEITFLAPCERR